MEIRDEILVRDADGSALIGNALNRPVVQQSLLKYQLSKMTTDRERLRFVPELTAFGNYGIQGQNNDFKFTADAQKWYKNSAIGLRLDVLIFSGAARYFSVAKAKLNQQVAALELQNTQSKLAKEDSDLLLDFTKAKDDLVTRRLQLKLAERNYSLALVKYKNQALLYDNLVNVNNELLTAQQQLLQAEANLVTVKQRIKLTNVN